MNQLVRIFYRLFYWLVPWWYSLTVFVTGLGRHAKIPKATHPDVIDTYLKYGRTWTADPWKGKVDIMRHPVAVQQRLDEGESLGDCDDHALYRAYILLNSGLADRVEIGTVWTSTGVGHVVCLYKYLGYWYWADYNDGQRFTGWQWAHQYAPVVVCAGRFQVSLRNHGGVKLHKRVRRYFP